MDKMCGPIPVESVWTKNTKSYLTFKDKISTAVYCQFPICHISYYLLKNLFTVKVSTCSNPIVVVPVSLTNFHSTLLLDVFKKKPICLSFVNVSLWPMSLLFSSKINEIVANAFKMNPSRYFCKSNNHQLKICGKKRLTIETLYWQISLLHKHR